jgi:hypothetical protein
MVALITLVGILLFFAMGVVTIYLVIDFIEYLKKYHTDRWEQLSFERLFGISQQDFFFYQFHPLKFIPYLFNKDDSDKSNVMVYKKRIQLSFCGILALLLIQTGLFYVGF